MKNRPFGMVITRMLNIGDIIRPPAVTSFPTQVKDSVGWSQSIAHWQIGSISCSRFPGKFPHWVLADMSPTPALWSWRFLDTAMRSAIRCRNPGILHDWHPYQVWTGWSTPGSAPRRPGDLAWFCLFSINKFLYYIELKCYWFPRFCLIIFVHIDERNWALF